MSAVGVAFGLGIGGVALALLVAKRATKSPAALPDVIPDADAREPITKPVWTPQFPADVEALLKVACRCVFTAPEISDELLIECVWRNHWKGIPNPGAALDGDHPSVAEALDAVRLSIVAARSGECDDLPKNDPIVLPDLEPVIPTPIPDLDPKPQPKPEPVDMAALTREDPTPGYFYQVIQGDQFLGDFGIVARALYRAVLVAAQTKGWTASKAQSRAAALAADGKARVAYLNIIQCSPWNDAIYGTWGYGKNAMPASHGRAIRLVRMHDAIYDRLSDGQTPIRTLDWGAPSDKGTGSATGVGSAYELLWLPPLRADALLDVNRNAQVVTDGLVWPGGLSKYNPPAAVQILGLANVPPGPFGCGGVAA